MSYIIPLIGYNSPPLSLNQRAHWAKTRSTAQKLAREVIRSANIAMLLYAQAEEGTARLPAGASLFGAGDPPGPAYLILSGQVRVERQRDDDNPAPTVKAAADALVRYGLVSSDDHRVMTRSVLIHAVDKMPPLHFYGRGLRQPARLWLSVDDLTQAGAA